jgi:hypothetical protein
MLHTGNDATLQVRIGIATGLVVVGDLIGTCEAQERGVVGDTPNLAQRLQRLAEPGQVLISDSTRRLSAGLFEYRDLGKVALKGLADPVQAWWVTGTSTVASRFEAQHETSLTPLVGRDEELELLLRPACPRCKASMMLLSIEPERPGVDLHTFQCAVCNHLLTTLAAYEDPMHSRALGRWLQGDLHPTR